MTLLQGTVAVLAIVPCLLPAQDSPQYRACTKTAQAQYDLNACAADEAKRVDAELNRVYRELLAKTTDDPAALEKIKKFQRAWIAYRDACIEATYPAEDKRAEYGSMYPMEVDLLGAKLTRQQIVVLKELSQER